MVSKKSVQVFPIISRNPGIRCGPHGYREDFLSFYRYKSYRLSDLLILGGSLDPSGLDWQDLCRKPLDIAAY